MVGDVVVVVAAVGVGVGVGVGLGVHGRVCGGVRGVLVAVSLRIQPHCMQ